MSTSINSVTATSTEPLTPSASEQASLGGHKAKTPIIAGSVCGAVLGLAWIIGFSIYFYKRYRRKKIQKRIGSDISTHLKTKVPISEGHIIIPPDPAVLSGQHAPGEKLFKQEKEKSPNLHKIPPPRFSPGGNTETEIV